MNKYGYIVTALFFPLLIIAYDSVFRVDETEQVIITQFGKPVGEVISDSGLKFKIQFI